MCERAASISSASESRSAERESAAFMGVEAVACWGCSSSITSEISTMVVGVGFERVVGGSRDFFRGGCQVPSFQSSYSRSDNTPFWKTVSL